MIGAARLRMQCSIFCDSTDSIFARKYQTENINELDGVVLDFRGAGSIPAAGKMFA